MKLSRPCGSVFVPARTPPIFSTPPGAPEARSSVLVEAALPETRYPCSSLCNLCVLCASVVENCLGKRTTETQRTQRLHREIRLSGQKPLKYSKERAAQQVTDVVIRFVR